MITIERKLENREWQIEDQPERVEYFIGLVMRHKGISRQEALEKLTEGKPVRYDTDWYAVIRMQGESKSPTLPPEPRGQWWTTMGTLPALPGATSTRILRILRPSLSMSIAYHAPRRWPHSRQGD